jgi:oxalate decarboxylase
MSVEDTEAPPPTDAGSVPNLRFSFSDAHRRLKPGGWAREATQRELPIATTLAGVNMRLDAGGVRELHWHKQAEWAYMLLGRARITAVDQDGRNFVADVGEGDLWYFPAGIPHSIQGLENGCEFLLVFNDGGFSEDATFLISDWFAHTPREVLAKNFGAPAGSRGRVEPPFSYRHLDAPPERGARRHHPHCRLDQLPGYRAGDVGYVPFAMGHYIENTGATRLRFLEMFRSDRFADVSLNQWMALTPPRLVREHLHLSDRAMAALRREKEPIVCPPGRAPATDTNARAPNRSAR